jgi:cold shock CspA family protein
MLVVRSTQTVVGGSFASSSLPLCSLPLNLTLAWQGKGVLNMRGTLTRFDLHSGVGAITTEQGMELSVHKNSMAPDGRLPKKGQLVEFRIYYGPNGPLAEDVHRLPSR